MIQQRLFDVAVYSGSRLLVNIRNYPVYDNAITFLFGESGIGKSVISKALYGYNLAPDLDIEINKQSYRSHLNDPWTRAVKRNSFFVFQEPSSHLNPLLTIRQQMNEGNLRGIDDTQLLQKLWQPAADSAAQKILDVFPKTYRPSGGEKQRVLLAMAFKRIDFWVAQRNLLEPTYFVFDEPTGSLDNNYRNLFLQLLFIRYAVKPFTSIIITHDYSIISELFRNYQSYINNVRFKELSRQGSDVVIDDFSPKEYLSWLETPKPPCHRLIADKPVLSVSSKFSIFGRNCTIYSDKLHSKPSSLVINKGDMVYLKAPSGIGKTTLAKIIMGIYRAEQFSMTLSGITITEQSQNSIWPSKIWGKRASMVFQHADESLDLADTVQELFKGLPIKNKLSNNFITECLSDLFDRRSIETMIKNKVAYLSGGQKQRLNLLRTLVLNTNLIILDEPLNGLDFNSIKRVLCLIDKKRSLGASLMMISHNEEIFEHCIDEQSTYYLDSSG